MAFFDRKMTQKILQSIDTIGSGYSDTSLKVIKPACMI